MFLPITLIFLQNKCKETGNIEQTQIGYVKITTIFNFTLYGWSIPFCMTLIYLSYGRKKEYFATSSIMKTLPMSVFPSTSISVTVDKCTTLIHVENGVTCISVCN